MKYIGEKLRNSKNNKQLTDLINLFDSDKGDRNNFLIIIKINE